MLEVSALHAYYGRAHILDDVTFTVGWGEVRGPARPQRRRQVDHAQEHHRPGAGRPGAGSASTATIWSAGRPYEIARLGLGYVPEERRVFPELTVAENLEVGRQPPRHRAPHWTPERLFALFPNLAELRAAPAGRISGGEQQMLTIARTLMGNPRAILLDEPSGGPRAGDRRADGARPSRSSSGRA